LQQDIGRQRQVNQARQDELLSMELMCRKKDAEAIDLKNQIDGINYQIKQTREERNLKIAEIDNLQN
jgi:hypothetical protein